MILLWQMCGRYTRDTAAAAVALAVDCMSAPYKLAAIRACSPLDEGMTTWLVTQVTFAHFYFHALQISRPFPG